MEQIKVEEEKDLMRENNEFFENFNFEKALFQDDEPGGLIKILPIVTIFLDVIILVILIFKK